MKTEILKEKYIKYKLTKDDVFKHQHYINYHKKWY